MTSANRTDRRITACIPYYRCRLHLRRAVVGLLEQTHREITVIVVNDGDPVSPWNLLADVRDRRLVRFDLAANHGPYFATAVALNATTTPYFLIQDSDDWSAPQRAERLLAALERDRSDFAVSAAPQFVEEEKGNRIIETRWQEATQERNAGNFIIHHRLTSSFKYRAPHHGLFRRSTLQAIGGYYGGLRISYDTLIPNLILMIGQISHVREGLYFRLIRPGSLTHGAATGIGTARAQAEAKRQHALYHDCFAYYKQFVVGKLTALQLTSSIRKVCSSGVTAEERQAIAFEARRLAAAVKQQTAQ